jgi:deoxyribodipyrimidine photo-lyase
VTRRSGALVWFRRDLRDFDHAALSAALDGADRVHALFVFDREILDELRDRADRRVEFILESVRELDAALRRRGGALIVRHGFARDEVPAVAAALGVDTVHANRDYEPAAIARDDAVGAALHRGGIAFEMHKDQVIFERDEVLTRGGTPFGVFTPYRNAWLARLAPAHLAARDCDAGGRLAPPPAELDAPLPTLEAIGFRATDLSALGVRTGMRGGAAQVAAFERKLDDYAARRDAPAADGTSRLSVHLRFGTVSIRALARLAHDRALRRGGEGAQTWLSELIWRDFYAQLLWHHPHVVGHAFRRELDDLRFPNAPDHVAAWCDGRTGYPLVDAGMRELRATGFMHNRLRMVTASFLVKDLLVDWRIGERHFARELLDYDLASNNGGWQWAASTGCDAQPWFRIFNPVTQSRRFDPGGAYIRRWVPELAALGDADVHAPWLLDHAAQDAAGVVIGRDYPQPIVDHARARAAALALFGGGAQGGADR